MKRRLFLLAGLLGALLWMPWAHAQSPNFYQCQFTWGQAGVSNVSSTEICQLDPNRMVNGAGAAVLLTLSPGANMTVTVQVTGDNPINLSGGGNWNNHDTLINETGSANGNIQFPVTGIRLNTTAYVAGTATLTVIMPGIPRG
jgi:hypothetical protein